MQLRSEYCMQMSVTMFLLGLPVTEFHFVLGFWNQNGIKRTLSGWAFLSVYIWSADSSSLLVPWAR